VIAVETKKVGALIEANRGELKGYFNALASVKLGILTDGLVFQLYTDTGAENMMDNEPFVVVDLAEVARDQGQLGAHTETQRHGDEVVSVPLCLCVSP
jgi:hypothetical protein